MILLVLLAMCYKLSLLFYYNAGFTILQPLKVDMPLKAKKPNPKPFIPYQSQKMLLLKPWLRTYTITINHYKLYIIILVKFRYYIFEIKNIINEQLNKIY